MNTYLLIIPALLILALIIRKKKKKHNNDKKKSWWNITYSPGMPERPTRTTNGWFFDFSTVPSSHVHYVQFFDPPPLAGVKSIKAKFKINGGGFVPQEFPDRVATVTLLIQRKGDNWGAVGEYAAYRWYSHKMIALSEGTFELSANLNTTEWGDVYGGNDPILFDKALDNVENVGLVFGSAGGRGHGVYATQPSRFELISYEFVR